MHLLLAAAGIVAGAIAAVSGFGIGSLLTPVLALQVGTKLAVAAVAIPHAIGTALRFLLLRRPRRVASRSELRYFERRRWARRCRSTNSCKQPSPRAGVRHALDPGGDERADGMDAAGSLGSDGRLGGLVGNQGGIRSAAMLGYDVPKEAFVATATAIALFVDAARLPVYLYTQGREISLNWPLVLIATVAVVTGTLLGKHLLVRMSQTVFRRLIALLLIGLGVYMAFRSSHSM